MSVKTIRTFSYSPTSFLLDDKSINLWSGEMHYFRIPREYWRDRFRKARAMGLNTICTYMPWNLHEPRAGEFDFSGMLDIAEYVKIAQEEGLLIILRPGPYICAEWDFGGFPSWLLKIPNIMVRCSNSDYLAATSRWIARVGEELSSLTCVNGGPIIMVQVENEYGAFGNDTAYMQSLKGMIEDGGFMNIPLFTCDWANPNILHAGRLPGTLTVANFGGDAKKQIATLRELRPNQPAMVGEFWCGWFDSWGKPRGGTDDPAQSLADLKDLLDADASFNLYMFHGGTNFGFTAGANDGDDYEPDVTSYDYRAPLNEAGLPTAKYFAFRKLLEQYGAKPPEIPESKNPISILQFNLTESAPLNRFLPDPIKSPMPQPMEMFDQSQGMILYRTDITGLGSNELKIFDLHDYAIVSINGKRIATLSRRSHEFAVKIVDVPEESAILEILVDTNGRCNFGAKILDRKGITDRVQYGGMVLMNWEIFPIPLDGAFLSKLGFSNEDHAGPAFHRGTFSVDEPGDTFLDMRDWKRGAVWVNGHNLGRYWSIGPQQTLFVPGVWLHPGENDILVFDIDATGRFPLQCLSTPILDEVRV